MMTKKTPENSKKPDKGLSIISKGNPIDLRLFSTSVGRNRKIIAEAFLDNAPGQASVLEIGSGTGQHGVYITELAPDMTWTFTDYNAEALPGISAWLEHAGGDHLIGPHQVDASAPEWGNSIEEQNFDVIFSANVIHIAPMDVLEGLIAGAERLLAPHGRLFLYGPFARNGSLAPSNKAFDEKLRASDARWGVRDLDAEILPLAAKASLVLELNAEMPTNNRFLVFKRC